VLKTAALAEAAVQFECVEEQRSNGNNRDHWTRAQAHVREGILNPDTHRVQRRRLCPGRITSSRLVPRTMAQFEMVRRIKVWNATIRSR